MPLPDKFAIIIPPQDISSCPNCIAELAAGNRQSFSWLYENYGEKVYQYAMLLTQDEELSSDIVQEVFLKIWIKRETLAGVEKFNKYLFVLTRNLIMDNFISKARRQVKYSEYCRRLELEDGNQNEKYQRAAKILDEALDLLPPRQRQIFRLRINDRMKHGEIAKLLNLSPFTIKSHRKKGMIFLKRYLENKLQ